MGPQEKVGQSLCFPHRKGRSMAEEAMSLASHQAGKQCKAILAAQPGSSEFGATVLGVLTLSNPLELKACLQGRESAYL